MFNAIQSIINESGKRVGFLLRDTSTGLDDFYSVEETIQLCYRNQLLNIKYTGKVFKKINGTMSSIPSEYQKHTKEKQVKKESNYFMYSGGELCNYISSTLGTKYPNKRDFVFRVLNYCKSKDNFVYCISGVRDTGKTVGILQAIKDLNRFNSSVYISFIRGKDIDFEELQSILGSLKSNIKYIFIDEITCVEKFINCSGVLQDKYVNSGKKIIVAGTDSYAIERAFYDGLFHRSEIDNVTFFSYEEAKRTLNMSLKDYIEMGGIYNSKKYKGIKGLGDYIDTSIVDNIVLSVRKNVISNRFVNVSNYDLRSAIYLVLYSIVYSTSLNFNFNKIINATINSENNVHRDALKNALEVDLGVSFGVLNKTLVRDVVDALEKMGVIIRCENICKEIKNKEVNYYIVSPFLANQVYKSILDGVTRQQARLKYTNFSQINGFILESIVVSHAVKLSQRDCFYYNKDNKEEIDLVMISREKLLDLDEGEELLSDESKNKALLVEVKLSKTPETAYEKGHWVRDVSENNFCEVVEVEDRLIVYNGKTDKSLGLVNVGSFIDTVKNIK